MRISEIFYSIQGEGVRQGERTVFLRYAGCDLKCRWCDTKYAWYEGEENTSRGTADRIFKLMNENGCFNLCVTGGEPLLQEKELVEVLDILKEALEFVSVETNCTILPANIFPYINQWSVSPKLPSSGETYKSEVLAFFSWRPISVQFKFVVCNEEDLDELERILPLIKKQVIVQPNGNVQTLEEYQQNLKWLAEEVLDRKLRVRVIPQLHRIIWGNERGV